METISLNKNELSSFLLVDKTEEIEKLINTFEMNNQFREKGLLSLDGMLIFFNRNQSIFFQKV